MLPYKSIEEIINKSFDNRKNHIFRQNIPIEIFNKYDSLSNILNKNNHRIDSIITVIRYNDYWNELK